MDLELIIMKEFRHTVQGGAPMMSGGDARVATKFF